MSDFTAKELKLKINEFIDEALAYLDRTEKIELDDTGYYPISGYESNEKLAYILQGGHIDLLNKILDKAIKEEENTNEQI